MGGHLHTWRGRVLGLIALAVVAVLPAAARAEDLWFRNDSGVPIIVQGQCLVRGKLVNDRPNLMQPGDKIRIVLPGNKRILIREAKAPNRLLHRDDVPAGTEDLYILISSKAAGVKLDRTTAKEFTGGKK
jgi:hypothetical protein